MWILVSGIIEVFKVERWASFCVRSVSTRTLFHFIFNDVLPLRQTAEGDGVGQEPVA